MNTYNTNGLRRALMARFDVDADVYEAGPGRILVVTRQCELGLEQARLLVPAGLKVEVISSGALVALYDTSTALSDALGKANKSRDRWRFAALVSFVLWALIIALGCEAVDPGSPESCDYQLQRCGDSLRVCDLELRRWEAWAKTLKGRFE